MILPLLGRVAGPQQFSHDGSILSDRWTSDWSDHWGDHQPPNNDSDESPHKVAFIVLSVFYCLGFLISTCIVFGNAYNSQTKTYNWDQRWVPSLVRRDACLMLFFPIVFLLPAFLWPLVVASWILYQLYKVALRLAYVVSDAARSATSCCGVPLPRRDRPGPDGATAPVDLEMGVAVCSEGEGALSDDGSEIVSDGASVRSAGSCKSDRPPSYTSVQPDEDGEHSGGEAEGLLAKGAE